MEEAEWGRNENIMQFVQEKKGNAKIIPQFFLYAIIYNTYVSYKCFYTYW